MNSPPEKQGAPVRASRFLSYVLRHRPDAAGITLDREGWADTAALIAGAARTGVPLNEDLLRTLAATGGKRRFALSADGLRIRAIQGHTVAGVCPAYEPRQPPERLFHGTVARVLPQVQANGLLPGRRRHVHLSGDEAAAREVGRRRGEPVVLEIAALAMHAEGAAFFCAENGVWLTAKVPPRFILNLETARSGAGL